ncbi:MAG: NAD(P)/FAD-dependent oxidoreductase [Candidatus Omnitrophica bacterium]|nr:NAD(P)/FAD-dependent oxidoreductase [Candidatus Omnitrophota bacterium]
MAVNIPMTSRPRIVIVGAGFAGLELAKGLKHLNSQVVLIDKNNHHTFQPLLYQVATAGLEPESIAYPIREIFRYQKNFIFRMAEVLAVTPEKNCVVTSIGEIPYDYLVISTGAKTNFFGMKDVEANALCMKTVPEAVELRNIILENFEKAVLTTSLEERSRLMTFVIVGGGPTGVELAGALGELKKVVLPHDHSELDFKMMQIHLVDMEDRLLKAMSPEASHSAEKFLSDHDVNVWLKTKVKFFDGQKVVFFDDKAIPTSNMIWTAGVTGEVLPGFSPAALASGRIKTDAFNRVCGHENIFAIGDVAAVITEKIPQGYPMLAPVAMQQARLLCQNLKKVFDRKTDLKPFVYQDLGVMATVGRHEAVADLFFGKFQGMLAWLMWAGLHLITLVGFRNRIVALVNWTWSYFRYDRGLRLIIRPSKRNKA